MISLPSAFIPPPPIITPFDIRSLGLNFAASDVVPATSQTWQAARRILYLPLFLDVPIIAKKMFVFNGTVVSGNVDIGLYASNASQQPAARLVRMGSTAQAGTSVIQEFDIADTTVGPGLIFMAFGCDNTTATHFRVPGAVMSLRGWNIWQETPGSWAGLPDPAAPGVVSSTGVPIFGLSTGTLI